MSVQQKGLFCRNITGNDTQEINQHRHLTIVSSALAQQSAEPLKQPRCCWRKEWTSTKKASPLPGFWVPRGEKDERGNKVWNSWLFVTWKYALLGTSCSALSWFIYSGYGQMGEACSGCENKKTEDEYVVEAQVMAGEKKVTWRQSCSEPHAKVLSSSSLIIGGL